MESITVGGVKVSLTPKDVAALIWSMPSDEQADMLEALIDESEGSHGLMMQFLAVREECEKREDGEALECFQTMFASAYKYMWDK